jgi:hypothetical protein
MKVIPRNDTCAYTPLMHKEDPRANIEQCGQDTHLEIADNATYSEQESKIFGRQAAHCRVIS